MRALQSLAFAFGDFLLIPEERLLLRGGEPVALTAKAFDLLVVLVRRAGHLVTKDELFDEVWPGTFVQETNLTVNISALRKAVDDGRDGSRIIQTVPGRGYRFVAPVVVRDAVGDPPLRPERAPTADGASAVQPVTQKTLPAASLAFQDWPGSCLPQSAASPSWRWRCGAHSRQARMSPSLRWQCCLSSVIVLQVTTWQTG
ncbi:MAG: transcriptional regulator [Mesorhizobium sp.]|uniref:winged helix-turn-helix domain-containing protein n=1 Tax=Mesorhizobium sp. TaxID=1871066 RepID=UPI000FE5C6C5|nr:transcriptional regulator [Mesorhizobium sp.]RWB25959.1 MAG: transcriptional regulator [Mesorhizobium sp.]